MSWSWEVQLWCLSSTDPRPQKLIFGNWNFKGTQSHPKPLKTNVIYCLLLSGHTAVVSSIAYSYEATMLISSNHGKPCRLTSTNIKPYPIETQHKNKHLWGDFQTLNHLRLALPKKLIQPDCQAVFFRCHLVADALSNDRASQQSENQQSCSLEMSWWFGSTKPTQDAGSWQIKV